MRVLLVSSYGDDERLGGAERTISLLARGLESRGYEIGFLRAFPGEGTLGDRTRVLHGADWKHSAGRRLQNHAGDVLSLPTAALAAAVEWHRPEVVHTHNLPGIGTGIWEVARRAGAPVVHTLHDYYLLCPRVTLTRRDGRPCTPSPALCGFRTRRLLRHAGAVSHVVTYSNHVLRAHAGMFGRAGEQVLRNPIVSMPPAPGGRLPPRTPPVTVGYLGSLERIKGVGLLLAAAPELARAGYALRFAGDGRMRNEVEKAAKRLPFVSYHGHVTGRAKEEFLASCDIGAVLSVWAEPGAPNYVMLEWLSAGRPVIASRRGGLGEAVEETPGAIGVEPTKAGVVGVLVELRDPRAWSSTLTALDGFDGSRDTVAAYVDAHEQIYGALRS